MKLPANMRPIGPGLYEVGGMPVYTMRENEAGAWTWRPTDPFTVDGISYWATGLAFIQPMFALKSLFDGDTDADDNNWDSPHRANANAFAKVQQDPMYAGVEWDPSITF